MFNSLRQNKARLKLGVGLIIGAGVIVTAMWCVYLLSDRDFVAREVGQFRERNNVPADMNINEFVLSQFTSGMLREEVHRTFQSLGPTDFSSYRESEVPGIARSEFARLTMANHIQYIYIIQYDENDRFLKLIVVD